jgi:hypothetical protein
MPSPKRPNTTRVLVQVPTDVHAAADTRRRRERTTWGRVVAELLRRWAEGDEVALTRPVKIGRAATPDAAETERLHQHWMATNEAYRRACTEKVDSSKLPRYRSLGELLRADAMKAGKVVPPGALAELDKLGRDDDG